MRHASSDMTDLLPWQDKAFRADPFPWYDRLREQAPVYQDPAAPETYVVSRYEDVVNYGRHPSLSVRAPDWVPRTAWSRFEDNIVVKDPPEHAALRRHSNKWLTPKMAQGWTAATAEAINGVLDELGPNGLVEAYRNLALMPMHLAMCRALGLPGDGFDTASDYTHAAMVALGSAVTSEEYEEAETAFRYLEDRVAYYIALRRREPNDGAVSNWIRLVDAGDMTEVQLREAVLMFWATGTPNAAYFITGGLEHFARNPDLFQIWRSSPDKRDDILNEIARLSTAEISFTRFTTEALEIRGVEIPAGRMIRFMIAAANRDPDVFPEPHAIRLDRRAGSHMTFGIGPHSCPGFNLARAGAQAIYNVLATRVQTIALGGDPVYDHDDRSFVYKRLTLQLTC